MMRSRVAALSLVMLLSGGRAEPVDLLPLTMPSQYPLALISGGSKPCPDAYLWRKEISPEVSLSALRLRRGVVRVPGEGLKADVEHLAYVPAVGVGVSSHLYTGLFDAAGALFHLDKTVAADGVLRVDEGADGSIERIYELHLRAESEDAVFRDLLGPAIERARRVQREGGDPMQALYSVMDADVASIKRIDAIAPEELTRHRLAVERGKSLLSCEKE